MAIDPSIIGGLKPLQLESPTNALAQMLQVQNAQQQNQLGQAKLDDYQRTTDRSNRLNSHLAGLKLDASSDEQVASLTRGGFLPEARSLAESSSKVSKEKRESEKFELESHLKKFEIAGQIMNGVTDQASWERAKAMTAQAFGPEAAAQLPAQYDPVLIEQKRAQAMSVKEKLEDQWKSKGFDLEVGKANESVRHNRSTESLTAAGQAQQERASLRTDARARDTLEAGKNQVIQSDTGPVLVNTRTGAGKSVVGADGQPLRPKLKDIPATVNAAMIANSQTLAQLDRTIALLEGNSVDGQQGDKAATGVKGYLPQQMLNKIDPKGIDARAGVADIGSLKLHDRSGAAVTASESPRLMPFIPTGTDSNEAALKKLKRLRLEAANESTALNETYGSSAGYKPSKLNSTPPKGVPDDIAALLQKHGGK